MAGREGYIFGWTKSARLFWSQKNGIDLHCFMVSAWEFIIIINTIKLQVCHWRSACRDDRKESSLLLEQKDDSNGKPSCSSLPSGYDATLLGGTAVWATILKTAERPKKQECLAAGNVKQEGIWKKGLLVNRTRIWVFHWLPHGWMPNTGLTKADAVFTEPIWAAWDSSGEGGEGLNNFAKVCSRLEEAGWLEVWALYGWRVDLCLQLVFAGSISPEDGVWEGRMLGPSRSMSCFRALYVIRNQVHMAHLVHVLFLLIGPFFSQAGFSSSFISLSEWWLLQTSSLCIYSLPQKAALWSTIICNRGSIESASKVIQESTGPTFSVVNTI